LQKNITSYIGDFCLKNDNSVSGPISMKALKNEVKTDFRTIKMTLHRLVKKGLLIREKGKPGIGGFYSFKINSSLKQLLLNERKNKTGDFFQLDNNPTTSTSSNILTTTKEPVTNFSENSDGEEKWKEIDISPLESIGFGKSHLKQLERLKTLTVEMVDDSIKAFAFDLEFNNKTEKIKGNPLSYFMGILRKGMPYLAPENYEPVETRTIKLYIEQKERQKQQKLELEKKAFDIALEEWIETLSEARLSEIIPEPGYRDKDSPFHKGALSLYFQKNVWNKNLLSNQ
jgi:hypothetical protein